MTCAPVKFKDATSYGVGGDTITRDVTDAQTHGRTDARTDGRRTDFGTKLIYPFFLKKKAGITTVNSIISLVGMASPCTNYCCALSPHGH